MTRFVSFRGLIPIFCQASPSLHMTKVGQGKLMVCCSMLRKGEKVNVETAVSLFNFSAMLSANARTSEADILHLEKKATKSTTRMYVCKSLFKHGKSSVKLKLKTKTNYNCFT